MHADHVTGTGEIKKQMKGVQSVLSGASGGMCDLKVNHGERVKFGDRELEVRATPGHTDGE